MTRTDTHHAHVLYIMYRIQGPMIYDMIDVLAFL